MDGLYTDTSFFNNSEGCLVKTKAPADFESGKGLEPWQITNSYCVFKL